MRKATRVPASSPARPCWQTHYPAGRVLIEGEVRVIEPQPILAGPAEIMERKNTLHAECEALGWWADGNDDACDERVDEWMRIWNYQVEPLATATVETPWWSLNAESASGGEEGSRPTGH